jgi:hypothetical protein
MRPILTDLDARIARANDNLNVLKHEIEHVGDHFHPYRTTFEPYMRCISWVPSSEEEVKRLGVQSDILTLPDGQFFAPLMWAEECNVFLYRGDRMPLERWSAIVGEIIHDLRSTLDHAVWNLTLIHQRASGWPHGKPGDFKPWTNTQFPIVSREVVLGKTGQQVFLWKQALGSELWGIDKTRFAAVFKKHQPFSCGKRYQRHKLWLLHQLSNTDKHRAQTYSVSYVRPQRFRWTMTALNPHVAPEVAESFRFQGLGAKDFGAFKDGTIIARFRTTRTITPAIVDEVHMDVHTQLHFHIHFKKGPPTYGGVIVREMEKLIDKVCEVVGDLGFPVINPLSPNPADARQDATPLAGRSPADEIVQPSRG